MRKGLEIDFSPGADVSAPRPTISDDDISSVAPFVSEEAECCRSAEDLVSSAARLLGDGGANSLSRFDTYPGPLYAVDRSGTLAYYNHACVALAGRTPRIGVDRWCVSHVLRTSDGDLLDHKDGPMADAVNAVRPVRGVEAIFELPDGERRRIRHYPTPALDGEGTLHGAVSLLVPLDGAVHHDLLATAQRCRSLAKWIGDRSAADALLGMAGECEAQAEVLRPA